MRSFLSKLLAACSAAALLATAPGLAPYQAWAATGERGGPPSGKPTPIPVLPPVELPGARIAPPAEAVPPVEAAQVPPPASPETAEASAEPARPQAEPASDDRPLPYRDWPRLPQISAYRESEPTQAGGQAAPQSALEQLSRGQGGADAARPPAPAGSSAGEASSGAAGRIFEGSAATAGPEPVEPPASSDGAAPAGRARRLLRLASRVTGLSAARTFLRYGFSIGKLTDQLLDAASPAAARVKAARELGRMSRAETIEALGAAAYRHPEPEVRQAAVEALLQTAVKWEPVLIREMQMHPLGGRRASAARQLGLIARYKADTKLIEALAYEGSMDVNEDVRLSAIEALGSAAHPKALNSLLEMRRRAQSPNMISALELALAAAARREPEAAPPLPPSADLSSGKQPLQLVALKRVIAVSALFTAVEFVGGMLTGSLSLRTDSMHLAGDLAINVGNLFALWMARRPPNSRKTYGYLKMESVVGLLSAFAISGMAVFALVEAIHRLSAPPAVSGATTILVAFAGLASNAISSLLLYRYRDENLSMKGAFLHAATDAVGSIGIILGGALIWAFGWLLADPIISFLIVALIAHTTWDLAKRAWNVLIDAVPPDVSLDALETDLLSLPGVVGVSDLHVWSLNSTARVLTAKIFVMPGQDPREAMALAKSLVRGKYEIRQSTLEILTLQVPEARAVRAANVTPDELKRHYASRRDALAAHLQGSEIRLASGRSQPRNGDVDQEFRQGSDFLYLTGVEQPGHHLRIEPQTGRQTLYIPRPEAGDAVWHGAGLTPAQAREVYGVEQAAYADELPPPGPEAAPEALRQALDSLRSVKTPTELKLMQRANDVSSLAHVAAMRSALPGQNEYEIQAAFEKTLRENGLKHLAYPSIVGAGPHSATLHYEENGYPVMGRSGRPVQAGDLILIDAAAELMGYAADITRTFPAAERFTGRQKDVYAIVLDAQKTAIVRALPGLTFGELQRLAETIIADGLKSLRLLKGDLDGLVESGAVSLFMPHGLSHMLGLDVHDVRPAGRQTKFEPGHVITVEPGVYFIPALLQDPARREKFKGQVDFARAETFLDFGGVRIEDDVVIERTGSPRNLTTAPKEISEIEDLRRRP